MKKVVVLIIVMTYFVVGFGIYSWQKKASLRVEKNNMEQINKLENQVETLMTNMGSVGKVDINTEPQANEKPVVVREVFSVYGMDRNVQEKEVNFYVTIDKSITTTEKVKLLLDKLSRFKFGYLPIEFVKINEENGKKIVVINLKESEVNQGKDVTESLKGENWRTGYFQGSAGGMATSYSLIETILQRKYNGDWIDGVEFLYEGKPIDKWEHAQELSIVNYRK